MLPGRDTALLLSLLGLGMVGGACSINDEGAAPTQSGGGPGGGGGGSSGGDAGWPDVVKGGSTGGMGGEDASDAAEGDSLETGSDADAADAPDATDGDSGTTWKPSDVPNCVLWLDAADPSVISLGGANVDSWKDKCGNGDAKSNGNQRPELVPVSGKHALRFDGVDDQLEIGGSVTQASEYTLFFVLTKNFVAPMVRPVWSNRHLGVPVGGTASYLGFNGVLDIYQNAVVPPTLAGKTSYDGKVVTLLYEYAVSGTGARELVVNGIVEAAGIGANLTTSLPVGYLAFDGPIAAHGQIDLYEVVVYTRLLSDSERATVRTQLQGKWGL